eukprot:TRINITY_DN10019_c0_g1_i2.p1 TRINITY_DN10019_c0_g1~~TRINITY_DN10019_c0_g1_i2.p1  ORF type:complete len:353 (+),score=71.97 TRINITY_DN10019_c0_g1_i2:37-1059(+)
MSTTPKPVVSKSKSVRFEANLIHQDRRAPEEAPYDFFSARIPDVPISSSSSNATASTTKPREPQSSLFFGTPPAKRKSSLRIRSKTPQNPASPASSSGMVVWTAPPERKQPSYFEDEEDDDSFRPPGLESAQNLAQPLAPMSTSSLEVDLNRVMYPPRRISGLGLPPASEETGLKASSGRYTYGEQNRRAIDVGPANYCVLVFGFPPTKRLAILSRFDQMGQIVRTMYNESSNSMGLEFESAAGKMRALNLNGSLVQGSVVGVKHIDSFQELYRGSALLSAAPAEEERNRVRRVGNVHQYDDFDRYPHLHQNTVSAEPTFLESVQWTAWTGFQRVKEFFG